MRVLDDLISAVAALSPRANPVTTSDARVVGLQQALAHWLRTEILDDPAQRFHDRASWARVTGHEPPPGVALVLVSGRLGRLRGSQRRKQLALLAGRFGAEFDGEWHDSPAGHAFYFAVAPHANPVDAAAPPRVVVLQQDVAHALHRLGATHRLQRFQWTRRDSAHLYLHAVVRGSEAQAAVARELRRVARRHDATVDAEAMGEVVRFTFTLLGFSEIRARAR